MVVKFRAKKGLVLDRNSPIGQSLGLTVIKINYIIIIGKVKGLLLRDLSDGYFQKSKSLTEININPFFVW